MSYWAKQLLWYKEMSTRTHLNLGIDFDLRCRQIAMSIFNDGGRL